MDKILLIIIFLVSMNSTQAQERNFKLNPIKEFYFKSLAVRKEDSIRYNQDSIAFRKRISENPSHAPKHSDFAGKYAVLKGLRRNKKKKLDSIIEVVKVKNHKIGVDSLFVVKLIRVESDFCEAFRGYSGYGSCALKVKDTIFCMKNIKQEIDRNLVYYFEGEPIVY